MVRASQPSRAGVRVEVYVQPRAARTELAGRHDGRIKIRVAAPPVDDAANQALTDFVAARLGVAKRCVRVVSGTASRRKVLEIDGPDASAIAAALKSPTASRG